MTALFSSGIELTALHNHLLGTSPNVLYLHFGGMGDPAKLAQGLRSALAATATPMGEAVSAPAGGFPGLVQGGKSSRRGREQEGQSGPVQFPPQGAHP